MPRISKKARMLDDTIGEIIICKDCCLPVKRYRHSKRPNCKDVRFIDENGREFNGRRCPKCHADKVKIRKYLKAHGTLDHTPFIIEE